VLDVGRMYQLVRQGDDVVDRTVAVTFSEGGPEAFIFTFG
jgi:hypothetical protein